MQLNPNDHRTYMYLGDLYVLRHEPQLADEAYTTAVKLAPESEAVLNLAIFYKYQGFNDEARELYEKALLVHPDKAWAEIEFGMFLKRIGEIEPAREHFREALRIEPGYKQAEILLDSLK